MRNFQLTGGARIGKSNVTYPLAVLKVEKDFLKVNASISGNLIFLRSDIISIEPYNLIPIIGQGIKIIHQVDSYDEKVVFWTNKNPNIILERIKKTGFLDQNNVPDSPVIQQIKEKQKQGGFPLKKSFAITMVVLWNLLIIGGFLMPLVLKTDSITIFHGILMALGMLFSVSLLSLISSGFRSLILKKGRNLYDIKRFLYFMLFLSGIMLLAFSGITSV